MQIFTIHRLVRAFVSFCLFLLACTVLLPLQGCTPDNEYVQSGKKVKPAPKAPEPPPPPKVVVPPPTVKPELLADPETPADSALLRVGITGDTPPYLYRKDKSITGLEADLLQQFAEFSHKKVVYLKVPAPKAIEALTGGHIDILAGGRKATAGNAKTRFTKPYLRSGQILLVREQNKALFTNGIYSLENTGYSFGVIQGSPGDRFVTHNLKGIKILRYQTPESAIQALNRKKIDLFLHDAPLVCYYASQKGPTSLSPILTLVTEEYMGWEIREDDKELSQLSTQFLEQSRANGQLQQTIKHWIPQL